MKKVLILLMIIMIVDFSYSEKVNKDNSISKLEKAKKMLDKKLITKEDYEKVKREVLELKNDKKKSKSKKNKSKPKKKMYPNKYSGVVISTFMDLGGSANIDETKDYDTDSNVGLNCEYYFKQDKKYDASSSLYKLGMNYYPSYSEISNSIIKDGFKFTEFYVGAKDLLSDSVNSKVYYDYNAGACIVDFKNEDTISDLEKNVGFFINVGVCTILNKVLELRFSFSTSFTSYSYKNYSGTKESDLTFNRFNLSAGYRF